MELYKTYGYNCIGYISHWCELKQEWSQLDHKH